MNELPGLPRRADDGHKGSYGTVLVIAGSCGMSGAAVLSGRAALRSGAGLVRVACPATVQNVVAAGTLCYTTLGIRQHADGSFGDGAAEELVELGNAADAVAIGPGLGRSAAVVAFVQILLDQLREVQIVLDADGLFAMSPYNGDFSNRTAPLVMTPHPGEFARLTGQPAPKTDAERQDQSVAFARQFGHILLLKGSGTLVTDGKRLYRNTTGNPGMASGGSGDVLSGIVAALIGQGMSAFDAAVLGAWVHGRAGDLAAAELGQTALTSADLLDFLPFAFRELETHW